MHIHVYSYNLLLRDYSFCSEVFQPNQKCKWCTFNLGVYVTQEENAVLMQMFNQR